MLLADAVTGMRQIMIKAEAAITASVWNLLTGESAAFLAEASSTEGSRHSFGISENIGDVP